jgi:hypothetical protein
MRRAREIAVFIASPGDLAPERAVFKETIDELNAGFADGAGVEFVPLAWEHVLATTGRRVQSVINREIERADVFVLTLHRRWGQDAPDSSASSYTEEEFKLAFERWKRTGKPEILIFFKNVDAGQLADPGPELTKVLNFRKQLEATRHILPRAFTTEVAFGEELDRHLRAFARGHWDDLQPNTTTVELTAPVPAVASVRGVEQEGATPTALAGRVVAGEVVKADLSLVQAYQTELALARAAVDAARDGRLQDAAVLFAKAVEGTTDLAVLSVAAEFYHQTGDIENASRLVSRQAAIAHDRTVAAQHYMSLMPAGFTSQLVEQMLEGMLAQAPSEAEAEEIRSIFEEAFGHGRMENLVVEMMTKHYTTAELIGMARFMGSAVGQSSLRKQALLMPQMMRLGQREVERVYAQRRELEQASRAGSGDAQTLLETAGDPSEKPAET